MQRWNPTLTFFRQRTVDIADCERVAPFTLSWELTKCGTVDLFRPYGSFVSCRMTAPAGETFGGGDGLLLKGATTRAFAEAWERLWLKIAYTSDLGLNFRPVTSNGFAAGPTNQMALANARGELIERATMLAAWQGMSGWRATSLKPLWLKASIHSLSAAGWTIKWYVLTTECGHQTLAVLGTHATYGAVFDCAYAGDTAIIERSVWSRLTNSLLRMINLARIETSDNPSDLPANGKPLDHRGFYRRPDRLAAFRFLDQCTDDRRIRLDGISGISSVLLHPAGLMPAVACALQSDLPALSWGTNSIAGRNPWPHPLA